MPTQTVVIATWAFEDGRRARLAGLAESAGPSRDRLSWLLGWRAQRQEQALLAAVEATTTDECKSNTPKESL